MIEISSAAAEIDVSSVHILRSTVLMFYHPVPVRVTYGMQVDGLSVFGVQNPSPLLQIASICFEDLAFRPQLQTTMRQRVQLALSAKKLRELGFPSFYFTIFKELAAGIPPADDDH